MCSDCKKCRLRFRGFFVVVAAAYCIIYTRTYTHINSHTHIQRQTCTFLGRVRARTLLNYKQNANRLGYNINNSTGNSNSNNNNNNHIGDNLRLLQQHSRSHLLRRALTDCQRRCCCCCLRRRRSNDKRGDRILSQTTNATEVTTVCPRAVSKVALIALNRAEEGGNKKVITEKKKKNTQKTEPN